MSGMSATTGKPLDGDAHLEQSIADILGTPIGTRVMRRDYGSTLFELIDAPVTAALPLLLFAAAALALARWEPRITVTRFGLVLSPAGSVAALTVIGTRVDGRPANSLVTLTVPLRAAGAVSRGEPA